MHVVDIVIPVVWAAFWIYWIAVAIGARAGQPGRTRRTGGIRLGGVRVPIVLIVLLLVRVAFNGHAFTGNPWLQGIGLAVFLLGLALAVWARVYLGRNWGGPMTRKDEPELVTTGPYRTVRHPIYTGIILGMVGTTIAVSLYWLIAVVVLGAYFIYSAVMEERYLAETFPKTYPGYKRSTKMLVPIIF
jgi:protein-S-isoprenylcysteine O-methyltransferase Ste14